MTSFALNRLVASSRMRTRAWIRAPWRSPQTFARPGRDAPLAHEDQFAPGRAGQLTIDGKTVSASNVRRAIDSGLSLVPEERRGQGLIVGDTIENNYHLGSPPWNKLVRRGRMRSETRSAISRFGVKAPDVLAGVSTLSGGNQQKIVIARSLASSPRVLLLDEPTRGVDVGAREEIYDIIRAQAVEGMGVLLASSEMTEILSVSDRVLVMHEHAIVGDLRGDEITEENIGLLSAGGRKKEL